MVSGNQKKLCWTFGLALAETWRAGRFAGCEMSRCPPCLNDLRSDGWDESQDLHGNDGLISGQEMCWNKMKQIYTLRYPLGIKRGKFRIPWAEFVVSGIFLKQSRSAASWADLWHRPARRLKVMKVMRVCPVTKKVWNGRRSRISRRSFRSKIRLSWTMKRKAMWTFGKEITRDSERNWTENAAATTYVWAAFDLKQKSINVYNFFFFSLSLSLSLSISIYIYYIYIHL